MSGLSLLLFDSKYFASILPLKKVIHSFNYSLIEWFSRRKFSFDKRKGNISYLFSRGDG